MSFDVTGRSWDGVAEESGIDAAVAKCCEAGMQVAVDMVREQGQIYLSPVLDADNNITGFELELYIQNDDCDEMASWPLYDVLDDLVDDYGSEGGDALITAIVTALETIAQRRKLKSKGKPSK